MINERQQAVFARLKQYYCRLRNPFFLFYFFFFIVAVVQFILLTFRVRAVCLQIHLEPADTGQARGDAVADGARSENNWIWFPSLCNVLLCIPYYVLIIKIE